MIYLQKYDSPLGKITLASEGKFLTGLWFDGQKYFGSTLTRNCAEKNLPVFDAAKNWLDVYFSGRAPDFTPPFKLDATEFRKSVWQILLKIPFGETKTYGDIAREIGSSARAVGNAVAHNPVSLIIPCHRVVGASGNLTGYAGGLDRKFQLLKIEGWLGEIR